MTSFAQSDYSVIKGNVAEKNVNITIINTSFGVSSDDKGDFIMMLPKMAIEQLTVLYKYDNKLLNEFNSDDNE